MKKEKKVVNTPATSAGVEGEGSYSATRRYNEGLKRSIHAGRSDDLAQKAKEALEGPEGAELERAERFGKKGNPKVDSARK